MTVTEAIGFVEQLEEDYAQAVNDRDREMRDGDGYNAGGTIPQGEPRGDRS